ncbi:MAG: bifunctional precorrin-2 dehydrogenase/sirohydrochlorin ferrochelatase [Armatimonadetes bacterium]|nr:bifunctional precorrin-2 dehydrogenase/sirohydrochlorin ferrochelatase [Armatimonadota bacterium]
MRRYLPICLDLDGKPAVVLGGGAVATERVRDLVACGARVTVISPQISPALEAEAAAAHITLIRRPYQSGDLEGAFLAVVATNNPDTNAAAFAEAERSGVLVNVTDDPEHCRFIFPARFERGPLTISIFTHGTSPALSRRMRRELEAALGPEYTALAEILAAVRPHVRRAPGLTQPDRQRLYEQLIYSDLLFLLREGDGEGARRRVREILAAALGEEAAGRAAEGLTRR